MSNIERPEDIIVGRVEPHIYAFETRTVPNYVKVGDTTRPVADRLDEWRRHYENLQELQEGGWIAKTENDKYFRDFAVHAYLESYAKPRHHRLQQDEMRAICPGVYYSKEFFEGVAKKHIVAALEDINRDAKKDTGYRYTYYTADRLPEAEGCYKRELTCVPRELQQQAIDRFKAVWERNKDTDKQLNLLMYAVMRFGKSITSMLCAKEMGAKIVLIVSAKTDVLAEWKHTVEAFDAFKGYRFLTQGDLKNPDQIQKVLSGEMKSEAGDETYDKAVIFLSLQDLSGTNKDGGLKAKFEELYEQNIDMMIIDETHYGARGESYGKVLQTTLNLSKSDVKRELSKSDETFDDLDEQLGILEKDLNVRVKLHLSGTPYRILMGSEFSADDIIIQCQYSDIVKAKEDWDNEHCVVSTDEVDDMDDIRGENPYFGFPQMVRFAFRPNESARQMMQKEKEKGRTASLNDLFCPTPVSQAENKKYSFVHRQEVLDLLLAIDGKKKDNGILPMLDFDKIRNGQLCHHMVWVLPLRASCDAMESLIMSEKKKFKHLQEYEIINIAGWNREKWLEKHNYVDDFKDKIRKAEAKGEKTITLTVNRMLTGVTVPEWDTMFFLKEASSPQEYDQAIFRLQSPYVVKRAKDKDGTSFAKFDMKPQTLLVDFDVDRMFYLQNQKALIGNINQNDRGGDELEKRHQRELEISPVLMMNIDGKLRKAEATDVIDAIRNYSAERSIRDEAADVRVDNQLFMSEDLQKILMQYNPIDAKNAFSFTPHKGDGEDLDNDDKESKTTPKDKDETTKSEESEKDIEDENTLPKRLANLISRIFFFAMLTDTEVKCVTDIIDDINNHDDAKRIAKNVDLPIEILTILYNQLKRNSTTCDTLSDIDLKIRNVRDLINDQTIKEPTERVQRALKKFGRLSESEIITPDWLADDMINLLKESNVTDQTKFLDIASKEGEFACSIYKRFGEKVKNNIFSLPTSNLTYEFTRKVYKLLNLPLKNIINEFNSYDLVKEKKEQYIEKLKNMNLSITVGNPPYQTEGDNNNRSLPIYNHFVDIANTVSSADTILITPARWYTPSILQGDFTQRMLADTHIADLVDYTEASACFHNVEIKGGVCYVHSDKHHDGVCSIRTHHRGNVYRSQRFLQSNYGVAYIRFQESESILKKVITDETPRLSTIVSSQNPFGFNSKIVGQPNEKDGFVKIISKFRSIGYLDPASITLRKDWVNKWKLMTPIAGEGGTLPHRVTGRPFISAPGECCNGTYMVIGPFKSKKEAENALKYMNTKFLRFLVSTIQNTQNTKSDSYSLVPLQDFSSKSVINWSKSVADIDKQLYEKYDLNKKEIEFIEKMIKPMA